jgi:hypothetical protein
MGWNICIGWGHRRWGRGDLAWEGFWLPKAAYWVYALDISGGLEITHGEGGGDLWDNIYILVEGTGGGEGKIQRRRGFDPQKPDIECVVSILAGAWK